MSDSPKKRIHSISNIISNNPAIVIYGIDVGDFRTEIKNEISLEEIIIHPKNFFLYQFEDFMEPIRDKIPGSPKDRSLLTIKYFLFGPQPHHHPFINFYETSVTPTHELKLNFNDNFESKKLDLSDENEEIKSLKVNVNSVGDASTVSLRPERVEINSTEGNFENSFNAKVKELIYLGDHIRTRVEVCGNDQFIVKVPNSYKGANLKEGASVKLSRKASESRALDLA